MTCGYCGSRRYSGESRCRTCGCRADDTLTGEFPSPFTDGALATQPRQIVRERGNVQAIPKPRPEVVPPAPVPRQGPLFDDSVGSAGESIGPKVVAIARNRQRPKPAGPSRTRRSPIGHTQGQLDFPVQAQPRKTLGTTVEAQIYCDHPVATIGHRAIAAGLDWGVVLAAYALFLAVYRLMGGGFALHNPLNLAMFAGVLGLFGLAYGLLWSFVGCCDSAGTRWAQLRITTFDGDRPEPLQRLWRLVGSCLSMCTVVGLLWSFADEESLTWQDHNSGTFPTPIPLARRRH